MKLISGHSAIGKLILVASFTSVILTVALVGNRSKAAASAFGPSPAHTNAPGEANCTSCHTDFPINSGSGNVVITGIPGNYSTDQQIDLTVTATDEGAVIYGFQLTAIDGSGHAAGTFSLPSQSPARTQILQGIVGKNTLRDYVEQTSDGLSNGQFGFNSWTFKWTAPAESVGKVDFYVTANAANSDGGTSGDYIYSGTASTLPSSLSLASISGKVSTPNGLALRNTIVVLTDSSNIRQTAVTSSFGLFNFSNIQVNSDYTLSVQSKRYRFTPKVLMLTGNLTNVDFVGLE